MAGVAGRRPLLDAGSTVEAGGRVSSSAAEVLCARSAPEADTRVDLFAI